MAYDMKAINDAMDAVGTAIQEVAAEIEEWIAGGANPNTVDPANMQAIADKLNTGAASLKAAKAASDAAQGEV